MPDARAAWLALAVDGQRQHGGNDGYDDEPSAYYSWDSTVPNHGRPAPGDAIALWDKRTLLGASIIEEVAVGDAVKLVHRCPNCGGAHLKAG